MKLSEREFYYLVELLIHLHSTAINLWCGVTSSSLNSSSPLFTPRGKLVWKHWITSAQQHCIHVQGKSSGQQYKQRKDHYPNIWSTNITLQILKDIRKIVVRHQNREPRTSSRQSNQKHHIIFVQRSEAAAVSVPPWKTTAGWLKTPRGARGTGETNQKKNEDNSATLCVRQQRNALRFWIM